jgi:hypothetical protein
MASTFALQKAAQAWTTPTTENKVMDAELALAFANIIDELIEGHNLNVLDNSDSGCCNDNDGCGCDCH